MLSLRTALVRSALGVSFLFLLASDPAAAQQTIPCGAGGAVITVQPTICQGDALTVNVANNGSQILVLSSCPLGVASGACGGPAVGGPVLCPGIDIMLPPGTQADMTWGLSTSVLQPGTPYFLHVFYADDLGNTHACCVPIAAQAGAVTYGPSKPGAGDVAPELVAVNGGPHVGNQQFTLRVGLAVGAANALLLFGTQQANVQGPFGTLLVDVTQPHIAIPVSLGGPPNAIGAGSLDLAVPIPNSPALVGFTGYVQCFVADFAAAFHWSHTNGLSVTVCP
jgi:hypothetical protein